MLLRTSEYGVVIEKIVEDLMDMQTGSVKGSIGADSAQQTILDKHPWASRWVIQVSSGLVNIVSDLLADFEGMLGRPPALAFLRITDEPESNGSRADLSALYQRKLRVFAQAQEAIDARDQALLHVIRNAVQASLTICCVCGGELEIHDISDDDERLTYPFLPKAPSSRNGLFVSSILVCMRCAQNKWLDERQKEEDELAALPANVDPADVPDGIKPPDALTRSANKIKSEIEYDEFEDTDEYAEEDEWDEENDDGTAAVAAPPRVAVFDLIEVNQLERAYADASKDQANRIKGLVKKIRDASARKLLVTIPADWRDYCEELTERFPNFAEVTAFIRNQLALSAAGDQVLRIPPFMLVGGPGIGKTEYALTIASDFQTKLTVIDVSNAQTGSALTGSEAFWSNSQPGQLFNTLALGEMANPIIMLDEVDKARGHSDYQPLAALHQLLEPRQAKTFHDLSVPDLTIDASHVLWMATANHLEALDQPIIDRFTVFHINDPSSEQMPAIVINQYRSFIYKHPSGKVFEEAIRDDVLAELCKHHPRKVRKLLEQSFGLAAFDKRNYLTVADIKASDSGAGRQKAGIGFLAADIH
ncbi:MAG: AAA family ATPase [Methylobacter sp.]